MILAVQKALKLNLVEPLSVLKYKTWADVFEKKESSTLRNS